MPIFKQTSKMLRNLRGKISEEVNTTHEIKSTDKIAYQYEVSVVTPSYKGENHILRLLDSMKNQTFPHDLFEHIIIINGELDSTEALIEEFKLKNPEMNIKIFHSKIANASNARNIGIQEAKGRYCTFIDDDDYVSSNYLMELHKPAADNRIVIARMEDMDETNSICYNNSDKENYEGVIEDPYSKMSRYFSFNACKLIPTFRLKKIKFDVKLSSGEDIVFFARLMISNDFEFYVVKKRSNTFYYRVLRSDSVSRKPVSYKFNVEDRLTVIGQLNSLLSETDDPVKKEALKIRINGQTSFIYKYLLEYPNEYNKIVETIKDLNLEYFNINKLNKNLAEKLIISFCFLPYTDISAYLMGKRIFEAGNVVDVIHNNMDQTKKVDTNISKLTEEYLGNNKIVNSIPTLGNWKHIEKFCEKGIETINKLINQNKEYNEVYSCSMYPASNFLAFKYKINHPNVRWVVEFSDQLIYDNIGDIINATIDEQDVLNKINSLLVNNGFPEDSSRKIFFLNEYLAYAFADELIFPSENQKNYMLNKFPFKEMMGIIEEKSRILAPPIPKCELYTLISQNYTLNSDIVNIAYFESVYEKINLEQVYNAIKTLKDHFSDKFMIHIFTNNPEGFKRSLNGLVDQNCLRINSSVDYFEFLNLTTKFDCLIVTDQEITETKSTNPYLPSRLNDCVGSGTDIWGICDEGSAMSKQDLKYKSYLNDAVSNQNILLKIIEDHLRKKF